MKTMLLIASLCLGFFYTRNEIASLVRCLKDKDYVEWHDLNRAVAARQFTL